MRISAIVLAAGTSRRMGDTNKLLLPVDGKPLVRRVVDEVLAAGCAETIVVVGHEMDEVREAVARTEVRFVENSRYREGMGTSIAAGAAAADPDAEGLAFLPADLPVLRAAHVRAITRSFASHGGRKIAVPGGLARHGHPKIFPARYRAALVELSGDHGAVAILRAASAADVVTVPLDSDGPLRDFDRPGDRFPAKRGEEGGDEGRAG